MLCHTWVKGECARRRTEAADSDEDEDDEDDPPAPDSADQK